jgi:hypothetical protein
VATLNGVLDVKSITGVKTNISLITTYHYAHSAKRRKRMEQNNVIVLQTEPVIEYSKLEEISKDVVARIDQLELDKIEANEDTIKQLKDIRAALNKESTLYEGSRKTIKQLILAPYEKFETSYKDLILNRYKDADALLKSKIDEVESKIKAERTLEIKTYFKEVCEAYAVDFVTYEQAQINVTLSASTKSLKDAVLKFVQQIDSDIQVIVSDENRDEIMVVYRRTLNLSQSVTQVRNDIKAREALKKQREEAQSTYVPTQTISPQTTAPQKEVEQPSIDPSLDEVLEVTFTVSSTRRKIRSLKAFIEANGITIVE